MLLYLRQPRAILFCSLVLSAHVFHRSTSTPVNMLPADTLSWYGGSQTKLPPHPRIRLNESALSILKRTIVSDPVAAQYKSALVEYADSLLLTPMIDCMPNTDLLMGARVTLDHMYSFGLLYRLSGNDSYAKRAVDELLHVTTNCTSWDPFGLVLAEMTHAVAVGYDWLFDFMTESDRKTIERGVVALGLNEVRIDNYISFALFR